MISFNRITAAVLILVASVCLFNFPTAAESSKKEGKKIYVPEDYKTIKEALENSEKGDRIYLAAGKYEETSGLRLKPDMEIRGASAGDTEITVGGIGVVVENGNVIADITFKLKGGQIFLDAADNATLRNCVISGSGGGNGVFIEKSEKLNIVNCTITNFVTGISIRHAPCEVLIKNCIFSNNRVFGITVSYEEDKGVYFSNMTGKATEPKKEGGGEIKVTLEYNDVWGSSRNYYGIGAGEHDISKDPKFVSESNYHLQSGSPCIDVGDPDSKYNDPDGSRSDMGALPYGVKKE